MLLFLSICLMVFLYFGVPFVYSRLARISLKRKTRKFNALVLSFDDGPGSRLTTSILEILAEHDVKVTFFLLGGNIPGREPIVRRIAEHGHQICSHGYDHLHCWKVSPLRALADIRRGWQAIDKALATKHLTYPYRPPYGRLNLICLLYLWLLKVPIVYWTFDLGDTWSLEKKNKLRSRLSETQCGAAVVLAHDFDRENRNDDIIVLDSLRAMLSTAKQKGMRILTVSELIGNKRQGTN